MTDNEFNELTLLYFDCHGVIKEIIKEHMGRYPRKYKRFERKRIEKIFRNVSYKRRTITDFSVELMSNLIVTHGLPNTNHRTTIFFISIILRELGIKFPDYDSQKNKKKWIDECNRYISKSKRILYRRKVDPNYAIKHKAWTKEWLTGVIGNQSNSSGMMSRHLLNSLKKISSSRESSSVIVK